MKLYGSVMLIRLILLSKVIKIHIPAYPSVAFYCPRLWAAIIKTCPQLTGQLHVPVDVLLDLKKPPQF